MSELGHIAFYVRNLERSVAFYQKVVGLNVVARIFQGRAAVLSGGNRHHDLLLIQVSTGDGPLTGRRIGLYHTGWKVGNTLNDLRAALDRAQLHGIPVEGTADHKVMFSLYLRDPDGNEVELFVDNPHHDWRRDGTWIEAPVNPLDLSRPQLYEPSVTADAVDKVKIAKAQPEVVATGAASQVGITPLPPVPFQETAKTALALDPKQELRVTVVKYDESADPDSVTYWLKKVPVAPGTGKTVLTAAVPSSNGGLYDETNDPDSIKYWLQIRRIADLSTASTGKDGQHRELQTPVTANYLLELAQIARPTADAPLGQITPVKAVGMGSTTETPYREQEDPDAMDYWLKVAAAKPKIAAAEQSLRQVSVPYDELQDPDAIARLPKTS